MPAARRFLGYAVLLASWPATPPGMVACARPSPPAGASLAGPLQTSPLDARSDLDASGLVVPAAATEPPVDASGGEASVVGTAAAPTTAVAAAPDAANATTPSGSNCAASKTPPARMTDAQLFAEIKSCGRHEPQDRGVLVLKEVQRRLRGRPLERTELIERIGYPNGGEDSADVGRSTKGQFTEKTADSVLVYQAFQWPMFWQFWFAAKNGRIVGSGVWQAPVE